MTRTNLRGKLCSIIAVTGALLFAALATGCQGDNINADLLQGGRLFLSEENAVFKVPEGPQYDPDWVFGAIVTPDQPQEVLNSIKEREKYTTVVLLAVTDFTTDTHQIFTYESAPLLQMDQETVARLTAANIALSLGSVGEGSFWNAPFVSDFTGNFPDARFVLVSINKNVANPETIGYALKSHLPDESIVFALADFPQNPNPLIDEFHSSFAEEVISRFDETRFGDLPAQSTVPLEVLGRYLRLKGAHNPMLLSRHQALFYKRGAASGSTSDPARGPAYQTAQQATEEPGTLYLVAFGDVMLGRYVRTLMDISGLNYPFEKMDDSYLKVNDLLLANLEGPITTKAIRTSTGMSFGFFPDTAALLKKHHFDLLSQANNHAFDKTGIGYEESLRYLREEGIVPFGNAREITGDSVAYLHVRGQKFAFFGLEEVNTPINDAKALETVKELVQKGYRVIVFPHWGVEYQHKANQRQRDLAHAWIDAGAYAVIGHHPHVIQTYETYKGRPIFYSLGNAIFDQYWSVPTQKGLSIALAMNDDHMTIYFLPITLSASQMRLMKEDEAAAQLQQLVSWGEHSEEEKEAILSGKLIL